MPGFGDAIQKAIYLGVGLASYAGEKASSKLQELRGQIQKLADEMVDRGEMTTEEARRFVEEMMSQAQKPPTTTTTTEAKPSEPRRIEILSDDDVPTSNPSNPSNIDNLRQQVLDLQEELRRLKRD